MSEFKIIGKDYAISYNEERYVLGEYFTVPDDQDHKFEGDTIHFKKVEKKKAKSPSKTAKKKGDK